MEFLNSEKCNPPELKTYGLYRSNGTEAERTGKVTNGVHGIWTFDRLPYAADAAYNYDVGVLSEVISRGEISVR